MKNNELIRKALAVGANGANVIRTEDIILDKAFRSMCEANACGVYGKCYMCPPDVGEIEVLMRKVREFDYALVYQTVTELEDSFDYEGMIEAKRKIRPIAQSLRDVFRDMKISKALHLSAGGCGVCEVCSKVRAEPCLFPDRAISSLEAYGINVSLLAKAAGMKYINGQNTVTYFGAVLFSVGEEIL